MILSNTTDKIQGILAGAVATNQSPMVVDFVDNDSTTFTPGRQVTTTNNGTAVDILDPPAGSHFRKVNSISILNKDTVAITVTFRYNANAVTYDMFSATLGVGEKCVWTDAAGWACYDAAGSLKQVASGSGVWLGMQVKTQGQTTLVTGARTTSIFARLQGAGASGGGIVSAATASGGGGGGGAGGYAEKSFAVTPSTTYTIAVGAGGTASAAGGNGNNGNDTTLAVGATTVTAKGGLAGVGATAVNGVSINLGGAGGPVSTNGDVNGGGAPGMCGIGVSNALAKGGEGGSCMFGGGGASRKTQGAGLAGTGFGAGSGGACCISAGGTVNSVAGQNGLLLVDEFA